MTISFKYFKHNPSVIQLAVLLYVRYPLSLRQVEDMLFDRGLDICTRQSGYGGTGSIQHSPARSESTGFLIPINTQTGAGI